MSNLVPLDPSRQHLAPSTTMSQRIQSGNTNKNFAGGVTGGFLVLSIRNSRFWLRRGRDAETPIPDPVDGRHATQVDVVLVNGSERLAKAYYAGVYAAGNADQPDCWSMDSVRPDPSVMHPINPTCQNCPMNEYKRDIGGGKMAKNCSDHRRVAVTFLNELTKPDPTIILLRVPQSSLRGLRNYSDMLARNGYLANGCITRLAFDSSPTISFPKLTYEFRGPLTDQEFATAESLENSPNTLAMLNGSDFANTAGAINQPSTINQPVQALPRQQSVSLEGIGFGPGMLQPEEEDEEEVVAPVQQAQVVQAVQQPQPGAQQMPPTILKLPDGKLFNTVTGQYVVEEVFKPEIDPSVITLPDGKFFNTKTNAYVDNQFTKPAPQARDLPPMEQPAEQPAKPARKRRSSAEVAAEKAAAAEKPAQQEVHANGNGAAAVDKPNVVSASPKLEQLLSSLAPRKE